MAMCLAFNEIVGVFVMNVGMKHSNQKDEGQILAGEK